MKGSQQIIDILNDILAGELTAINQYFLHARTIKSWGYERLGQYIYKESIEEMKHAEKLIDRVLFLEGIPNVQRLLKVNIGENIEEMFKADLQLEKDGHTRLVDSIKTCFNSQDNVTRDLLEEILKDSEHHIDWIEAQLKMISDVGVANYLAHHMHK